MDERIRVFRERGDLICEMRAVVEIQERGLTSWQVHAQHSLGLGHHALMEPQVRIEFPERSVAGFFITRESGYDHAVFASSGPVKRMDA